MASPHDLEFMKKNPHCTFCSHCYIKFFTYWCDKFDTHKKICAKECAYYSPTTNKKAGK